MKLKTKLLMGPFVLTGLAACGPQCQPTQFGNLQVLSASAGNVDFSATVATDEAGFNQDTLALAPFASFNIGVEVAYTDNFTTSTTAAQKEILVMARDPFEYESTLESLASEDNCPWIRTTVSPGDPNDPNCPQNGGVSLPRALAIPYPIDDQHRDFGSITALSQTQFAGSQPFTGPPAANDGSTKGLYVYRRGVCSRETNLRNEVLTQILQQLPPSLKDSINEGFPTGIQGDPHTSALSLAAFVRRDNTATLTGGFVMQLAERVPFQSPPFASDAVVARNYTSTFILDNGILSVATEKNPVGFDTGAFSGSIASGLDDSLPRKLPTGIRVAALKQQAQSIPNPNATSDKECLGSTTPAKCFQPCANVPDDPAQWPAALSSSNGDDSTWYDVKYCTNPATIILNPGVSAGAQLQGITDTRTIGQLQENLTGLDANHTDRFRNVRCNFYPDYVSSDPNKYGGKAVPVCEFVVRAKRLNVLPDILELVWFDAPTLDKVGTDEFTNEAFSVFLLAKVQGSTSRLCGRTSKSLAFTRTFAHVSLF